MITIAHHPKARRRAATSALSEAFGRPPRKLLQSRRAYADPSCEHCCAGYIGHDGAYEVMCHVETLTYKVAVIKRVRGADERVRWVRAQAWDRSWTARDGSREALERARAIALGYVDLLGARPRRSASSEGRRP